MLNLQYIIKRLEAENTLSIQESFEIARDCSALMDSAQNYSRCIAINILNNWAKIPVITKELWSEIIEGLGFYPYLAKEHINLESTISLLRYGLSESHYLKGKLFHDDQKRLANLLYSNKNVVASAPTSFGKSLLIEDLVASKLYHQIVIIQPTLALLDETRKKLIKYSNDYKLIVRTSQEPSMDKGNIFLFTAERVNEYSLFTHINLLIIDEFYKLSGQRDDERSSSLNNAFYKVYSLYTPQFYFLGPNIDNVSNDFLKQYHANFFRSEYTLVDSRTIDIYKDYENQFGNMGHKKIFKEKILFELLSSLKEEQTIIYCSSPDRVRYLAKTYIRFLINNSATHSLNDYHLIEWIKKNISETWMLIDALKYDIGIHDGALQKHITTTIINYFNTGKLKYLFCTSTIIEGVNTTAKNIIYFDSKKGPNEVDFFDYSNIKGRAGRLMEHYVGNIYNFNPPPSQEQIVIDIPFVDQNPIKDEVLIQLSNNHIKNKKSEQYQRINSIPEEEKTIIKRNGINIFGQKKIINTLMSELPKHPKLYSWTVFPTYEQLNEVLNLAWDNLIVEGETTKPMTQKSLLYFTWQYLLHKDEQYLIKNQFDFLSKQKSYYGFEEKDLYDIAIQRVFQTIKHWMQYKVPKWLTVINDLQAYVCSKVGMIPGNYIVLANLLENGFTPENLSIMLEFGIPISAVRKLSKHIPNEIKQDYIFDYIKQKNLVNKSNLIQYEKEKVLENI